MIDEVKRWRDIDIVLSITAALLVAYGVLALGWSVFVVIALFWFENVIIGVVNVAKMLTIGARTSVLGLLMTLVGVAFFTLHYGLFTVGHGVLLVQLFGQNELADVMTGKLTNPFTPIGSMLNYLLTDRDGWFAALGIVMLQSAAFLRWWSVPHTDPTPPNMFAAYGRIIILHVTIIGSAFLFEWLRLPVLGALLLVALKLTFDIVVANRTATAADLTARLARRFPSLNADARRT